MVCDGFMNKKIKRLATVRKYFYSKRIAHRDSEKERHRTANVFLHARFDIKKNSNNQYYTNEKICLTSKIILYHSAAQEELLSFFDEGKSATLYSRA